MADINGFMKYDRKENQKISPIKRVVDFSELFILYGIKRYGHRVSIE